MEVSTMRWVRENNFAPRETPNGLEPPLCLMRDFALDASGAVRQRCSCCWRAAPAPPSITSPPPAATPSRHHGAAVRHPAEGARRRRGGRHRLDPRRHLPRRRAGASATSGYRDVEERQSDTQRIRFWAYPGELPMFDFSRLAARRRGYNVRLLHHRQLAPLQGTRGRERAHGHPFEQRHVGIAAAATTSSSC